MCVCVCAVYICVCLYVGKRDGVEGRENTAGHIFPGSGVSLSAEVKETAEGINNPQVSASIAGRSGRYRV